MQRVGFGGGCYWCTEAVFQSLRGVNEVEQGFMRAAEPNQAWSEAVRVTFDPEQISLEVLLEVHLRTHSSSNQHAMREKYRSAVYAFTEPQAKQAQQLITQLQTQFEDPLITQVLDYQGFKPSLPQFQNYYRNGPSKPFCQRYIDPKLDLIRAEFSDFA